MGSSLDSYYDEQNDLSLSRKVNKAEKLGVPYELARDLTILISMLDKEADSYSHSFGIKVGNVKENLRKYTL